VLFFSVILVLGLGLGAFSLVRFFGGGGLHNGGPLAPREGSSVAVTGPVDVHTPYSWGLIHLHNAGGDPAHLEALDLGRIPRGLRVLGSYAVPGNAGIGLIPKFEPSKGQSVVGLTIPPETTYNIVVGLSATTQGRHLIPNVRVRYTSGGRSYEATFQTAIALCAPKAESMKRDCPSPLD
jgi:hypothetical protein